MRALRRRGRAQGRGALWAVQGSRPGSRAACRLPELWRVLAPRGSDRPLRALLAYLCRLRPAPALQVEHALSGLPATFRRGGCQVALSPLRPARLHQGGDRLVWDVLPAPGASLAAPAVLFVRRAGPQERRRRLRALLGTGPGPACQPGAPADGRTGRPGVARPLRRVRGAAPLHRTCVPHGQCYRAHHRRQSALPPTVCARKVPSPGALGWALGADLGGVLGGRGARFRVGPGGTPRPRASPTSRAGSPCQPSPGRGGICRPPRALGRKSLQGRDATPQGQHHRGQPRHRARPCPFRRQRTFETRLVAGRGGGRGGVPRVTAF